MLLAIRSTVIAACLMAGITVQAQELIPWATSMEQAQRAATEQRKLLLLHFYNDNCEPCERLEKNVFNQPEVATAIGKNFIPVKVHAGMQSRVAEHYRVERWPTDVICTPEGLEIYRTISPGTPDRYTALCDGVALQAGVGAGRQWATTMQGAGQQALNQTAAEAQGFETQISGAQDAAILAAANGTNQAAAAGNGYLTQANTAVQGYAQQADQQVSQATQQVNQAAQQASQTAQQTQAKAQDWTRRLGDSASQLGNAGQQFGQAAQTTARDLRTKWDQTSLRTQSPYGAAPPAAAAATVGTEGGSIYQPNVAAPSVPERTEPSLPTSNPWVGQQTGPYAAASPQPAPTAQAGQNTVAPPPEVAAAIATIRGPQTNWQPTGTTAPPTAAPTATNAPTTTAAQRQLVEASKAPLVALEGYCPVTLLDARQWHKSDPKFGAIHRGRTYLFRSPAEQTKFLADPDRYSPVLSGFDPVVFAQRGEQVEGKRSYGLTYNRQIYLFAEEASLKAFEQSPQAFATAAHTAMLQAETTPRYR